MARWLKVVFSYFWTGVRRQPCPMKLVLLVIIGWLVTQFSQKRHYRFFWFFAWSSWIIKVGKSQSWVSEKNSWFGDIREKVSKLALVSWLVTQLRDYEGTKVMEPDFWKKILDLEIFTENLQISPKSDTDIFLKNGSNDVFGFWPEVRF